jgi:hypothetical protein
MAGHLPEDAVARHLERRRQPVRVGRLKVDRQTLIVGGPPAVHMIIRRHETDVFAVSGRPDISQVEHPQ